MMTEDNGLVRDLCNFLSDNVDSGLPTRFQPSYQQLFKSITQGLASWTAGTFTDKKALFEKPGAE
eukprot:345116-Alexandrium_andersonii.AAC.1